MPEPDATSAAPLLRVLLVDDEAPARRGLRLALARYADVEVVGEAATSDEAVAAIAHLHPTLVVLDIQMPGGDGFDVIRRVGAERMPAVIFCTAYDEYAVQAFETQALDYVLKPLDPERLGRALERVRRHLSGPALAEGLRALLARVGDRERYRQRFVVRDGARAHFVAVSSVDWLEADGNYVKLVAGAQRWLVRDTLTQLERELDPARFLRVHRSFIVSLARVVAVESMPSGEFLLTLTTGQSLTSGRTYRHAIQAAFGL